MGRGVTLAVSQVLVDHFTSRAGGEALFSALCGDELNDKVIAIGSSR